MQGLRAIGADRLLPVNLVCCCTILSIHKCDTKDALWQILRRNVMFEKKTHFWQFEFWDSKSQWIFNTPGDFAESLGLFVVELGHFYMAGHCYTERYPENSFCLSFSPDPQNCRGVVKRQTRTEEGKVIYYDDEAQNHFYLNDNRIGYIEESQILCSESYFIQMGGTLAERYAQLFLKGQIRIGFESDDNNKFFLEMYEKLVFLYQQPFSEKRDLYGAMLLNQILTHLLVGNSDMDRQSLYVENKYVKETLEAIETRYSEDIKLNMLAEELHINPNYLSRRIKVETGSSFSSHVIHVRINKAKQMLITTEYSVDEIADRCGFYNATHLIRLFQKYENTTPKRYRLVHKHGINKV